jgi:two-component system, OmpR family, response regulator BaeR
MIPNSNFQEAGKTDPPLILIVEDENKLAQLLAEYLQQENFETHIINDGNLVIPWLKACQKLQSAKSPEMILLDIMLPGKDGITLCKEIRSFSKIPIIIQSARVDEIDRLLGLELGADDYICKPYSPREVVARVKAVLRRSHYQQDGALEKIISLDEKKLQVSVGGSSLELTPIEFELLKILYQHPGQIFSREQLMQNIYQDHRVVSDRTVDSHIKKLRKKMASLSSEYEFIYSVYGAGYKFEL